MRCESLSLTSVTVEELPSERNVAAEFHRTASQKRIKWQKEEAARLSRQPINHRTTRVLAPSAPCHSMQAPGGNQKRHTAQDLHQAFISFSLEILTEQQRLMGVSQLPPGGIH